MISFVFNHRWILKQVLIVTDSTEEDEGNYICKAKDHNNLEESTSVYVQIHGQLMRIF